MTVRPGSNGFARTRTRTGTRRRGAREECAGAAAPRTGTAVGTGRAPGRP
ncbi:hypothetical protein ACLVWQ_39555 [Streptomyces sp. CWNU-52B]